MINIYRRRFSCGSCIVNIVCIFFLSYCALKARTTAVYGNILRGGGHMNDALNICLGNKRLWHAVHDWQPSSEQTLSVHEHERSIPLMEWETPMSGMAVRNYHYIISEMRSWFFFLTSERLWSWLRKVSICIRNVIIWATAVYFTNSYPTARARRFFTSRFDVHNYTCAVGSRSICNVALIHFV